jgi:predicted alpha/beta-hydrolase family hydrolase
VKTLFISGTRDEFGTVEELKNATATIDGAVTHKWIEGARHDLKNRDAEVAELVAHWIMALPS